MKSMIEMTLFSLTSTIWHSVYLGTIYLVKIENSFTENIIDKTINEC